MGHLVEPASLTGLAAIVAGVFRASEADSASQRKARGAFFTPPVLCNFLAEWAVREASDRVLEPSCGEAAFLLAAGERLRGLGSVGSDQLRGIELHGPSARAAAALLADADLAPRVDVGDFFSISPDAAHDAVIGNPPYVRYQDFSGESRARARLAALAAGVRLTALASSWAAFTVHASLFLKPAGRLGLVLPAELLSVNYAGEVRRWLMSRFARVRLILFEERVFPGVLEEVVLLLAEGEGPTDHCELHQVRNVDELVASNASVTRWRPSEPSGKWTQGLLAAPALAAYREVIDRDDFCHLEQWGETTLGAVTGNNGFFALNRDRVAELGLSREDVLPLSPPGSRHLRSLTLSKKAWRALEEANGRAWLFRPPDPLSPAAARYIEAGEREGVNRAYKCRVRNPWWETPVVPPADLLVTCMNADAPRLTSNLAGVYHLNSVHGLYVRPEVRELAVRLLPIGILNSMTLVGAETVGRAYGGGVLKLEPREADRLPVPSPELLERLADRLESLRTPVEGALAAGQLPAAVDMVNSVVLRRGMGLSASTVAELTSAREALAARRASRGRSAKSAAA